MQLHALQALAAVAALGVLGVHLVFYDLRGAGLLLSQKQVCTVLLVKNVLSGSAFTRILFRAFSTVDISGR